MYSKFEDYAITSRLRGGKATRRSNLITRLVYIALAVYLTFTIAVFIAWAVI